MREPDGDGWERIERQARQVVASHVLAGDKIEPATLAAEVLRANTPTPSPERILRLEIYIRRQLPAIETMVAELHARRGKP